MKKYEEKRPWGNFVRYTHNEPSSVKIITVEAGQSLSLQYHNYREEFWRILEGKPLVEISEVAEAGATSAVKLVSVEAKAGDEFFIEKKSQHRISAQQDSAGKSGRVVFLEIAFGGLDENDIVRIEDKYGRAS